jgi:hypothetical protein
MSTFTINTPQGAYRVIMKDVGFLGLGTSWECIEPLTATVKGIKFLVTNAGFLGLDTQVELRDSQDTLLGSHKFSHLKPAITKGVLAIAAMSLCLVALYYGHKDQ